MGVSLITLFAEFGGSRPGSCFIPIRHSDCALARSRFFCEAYEVVMISGFISLVMLLFFPFALSDVVDPFKEALSLWYWLKCPCPCPCTCPCPVWGILICTCGCWFEDPLCDFCGLFCSSSLSPTVTQLTTFRRLPPPFLGVDWLLFHEKNNNQNYLLVLSVCRNNFQFFNN